KDTLAVPFDQGAKRIAVALTGTGQDRCCLARVHLLRLDGVGGSWLAEEVRFRRHPRSQEQQFPARYLTALTTGAWRGRKDKVSADRSGGCPAEAQMTSQT